MNSILRIRLDGTPEQFERLRVLQQVFAQACNTLATLVQKTRVWNRVTLHHLAYKPLRDQFPALGSQMACNAIYSVSRTSRLVFQHPASPFNLVRLAGRPLPLLRFTDGCPVYFDRHTLSLRDGLLSLYTLDGRIRFQLSLRQEDEVRFREEKLREVVLSRIVTDGRTGFELVFHFGGEPPADGRRIADGPKAAPAHPATPDARAGQIPEYVMVEEA